MPSKKKSKKEKNKNGTKVEEKSKSKQKRQSEEGTIGIRKVAKDIQASSKNAQLKPMLVKKESKENKNLDLYAKEIGDVHTMPITDLYRMYGTHPERGLSEEVARQNLEKYGINALTPPYKTPPWLKLLIELFGGFAALLWTGAILCFLATAIDMSTKIDPSMDNFYLGIALVFVVILSGVFSFYQEYSSDKAMESFQNMIPREAWVVRDGKDISIPVKDLVRGDLVKINFGDRVPADIRIIESDGLKVDNSSLTGESEPQTRSPECTNVMPTETRNLVFFSTDILEGTGKGIVVLTGDSTNVGLIAKLSTSTKAEDTPIRKEIKSFIKIITSVAVSLGIGFFCISLLLGHYWLDSVIFLIGIIVANVPEGLLATVTVCLTLTSRRMKDKQCLVKQLEAVETLGSTSCICSDKTGTLTQNKMTVSHMWYNKEIQDLPTGKELTEYTQIDQSTKEFKALERIIALCSRAEFVDTAENRAALPMERKVQGDASESALIKFVAMIKGGMDEVTSYRKENSKICEIPFNSVNKFQLSIHKMAKNEKFVLVMKGAPERIFDRCNRILINGDEQKITEKLKDDFNRAYENLGGLGERVFGFCDEELKDDSYYKKNFKFDTDNPNFPMTGLRFIGLVSMNDPPRDSVPNAIKECQSASIKVIMVTGDHPATAKAIARKVHILGKETETQEEVAKRKGIQVEDVAFSECDGLVISGKMLGEMDDGELKEALRCEQVVFARTSPEQKLRIVKSCQSLKHIVAVTGDGVNDSPALKKADIGVAMGISGSDVSKEVADMILMNDDFSSIVTGIEEGRLIFDNLKKSIAYTLSSNIPELVPFLAYVTFGVPLPLGTITILCIDLGTDMVPAISLGKELAERDIMERPPRDPKVDDLVNGRMISLVYGQIGPIQAVSGFLTYTIIMAENGFRPGDLLGLRERWDSRGINDLQDSYGQEWSFHDRKRLEFTCHTAYFVSIVIVQWADLIICKTRKLSIVEQGFRNSALNFAIFFETALAICLAYTPGLENYIRTMPLKMRWWIIPMPFSFMILCYDEMRKFLLREMRGTPIGDWVFAETYY